MSKLENITDLGSTIIPPLPVQVHLGLAVLFTTLYGLLFLLIMWQLLAILYYGHRKFSYQTVFLFICLVWAGLRTTLFSFYFQSCALSNQLNAFSFWLLFAFPVYLQFAMLSVLVLFFVLVVVKITYPQKLKLYRNWIILPGISLLNIIFLTTNISSSILFTLNPDASYQQTLTVVRVSIDYMIFLITAVTLSASIIKLTQLNTAKVFLEGQGVSFCQAVTTCTIISLLYMTRAVYNILAVSNIPMPTFGYGWINVSDQGEVGGDGKVTVITKDYAFLSFGLVLFIWELAPTFITVWLFRVQPPEQAMTMLSHKSDSFHTRSYFFDDPHRYDSDEDLSIPYTPPKFRVGRLDIPTLNSLNSQYSGRFSTTDSYAQDGASSVGGPGHRRVSSYGSVPTYGSFLAKNSPSRVLCGSTPPQLIVPSMPQVHQNYIREENEEG